MECGGDFGRVTVERWQMTKLVDLAAPKRWALNGGPFGSKLTTKHYTESGVPVIRGTNLSGSARFSFEDFVWVSEEKADELLPNNTHPGDLVFTQRGTIGQVGLIPLDSPFKRFIVSQSQMKLTPDPAKADAVFLYHFFSSPSTVTRIENLAFAAGVPHINLEILRNFEVPVPPLPVQRRIASVLSAYDDLIENCQRRIRILEDMARSLYREWFVQFRFPEHENHPRVVSPLGEIPKGWESVPFTDLADVLSGGTPKTDVSEYWGGEIPFFTPRDVPDCFYVLDAEKHVTPLGISKCASELYPPDTVFITARGTVGKVTMPSVPMAMNQSCYALRGRGPISQQFIFLLTLQQVDYLKANTGGATFSTIVVDTFRRMQVVKPPAALVARFSSIVGGTFAQVNVLQRRIQNLRQTRDLLLPRLLSGQVDLKVA